MKIFKKIATILVMITLVITSAASLPVKAATTDNVKLCYARLMPYSHGNKICYAIKVKNLGYDKKVEVRYACSGSVYGVAYYYKSNNDGTETWIMQGNPLDKRPEVYIQYEVNGKTYIDNNNGNYYTFGENDAILNDGPVLFTSSSNYFGANIVVKNLAYNKKVGIRYSDDNWTTYSDIPANYVATSSDNTLDYWNVNVPGSGEYAVYYEVNGIKYWDNNFGNNYTGNLYDLYDCIYKQLN